MSATASDKLAGGVACTVESEFMELLASMASTQCGGLPKLLCFHPYWFQVTRAGGHPALVHLDGLVLHPMHLLHSHAMMSTLMI